MKLTSLGVFQAPTCPAADCPTFVSGNYLSLEMSKMQVAVCLKQNQGEWMASRNRSNQRVVWYLRLWRLIRDITIQGLMKFKVLTYPTKKKYRESYNLFFWTANSRMHLPSSKTMPSLWAGKLPMDHIQKHFIHSALRKIVQVWMQTYHPKFYAGEYE